VDQIGDQVYYACLAAIERATPVDHGLYVIADRYLGQAMLDILENGESVEAALSRGQTALEAGPWLSPWSKALKERSDLLSGPFCGKMITSKF